MKKILIYIILLIFTTSIYSNEMEVIELHENKSLDQIVLDQVNEELEENENIQNEDVNNISDEIEEDNLDDTVEQSFIEDDIFFVNDNLLNIEKYLDNAENLESIVLQNELLTFLEQLNLDLNIKKNEEIYYLIIKHFYKTGNISKAHKLIKTYNLDQGDNKEFYKTIEVNYLLSTFQLENVCSLKEDLAVNLNLKNFFLEKIDIFCLVLEGNISEADLLNSIILETETNIDENFQNLYSILSNQIDNTETIIDFNQNINDELIFLYSAMARIAEIPLNHNFLKLDSKNLAIPIILNESTPIELRIAAANESYKINNLTIDSLAALYQSVDFNSEELKNPKDTLKNLSSPEITMAYYFQLINIQIFPSERLKAVISFWEFARENNLEYIAYSLTNKLIETIELSEDNIEYGTKIATAYIYNNNFESALNWLNSYENIVGIDSKSSYTRILLSLYSTKEIDSFGEIISNNFDQFSSINNFQNEELLFILLNLLQKNTGQNLTIDFTRIYDDRLMPSAFIIENLEEAIRNEDYNKFLIYSIISLNNKKWNEIHPQHLKLILEGVSKKQKVFIEVILEIFQNYKIL